MRQTTSFEPLSVKIDQPVWTGDELKGYKMDRQIDTSLACTIVQCRVLRAIASVDGKHRTLAPCQTKTPSPIHTKFGTIDYVAELNIGVNCGNDRIIGGAPRGGEM